MAKDKEAQRQAARRHYEKNKEAMKIRAKVYTQQQRERIRKHIRQAKNVPCADCGLMYPPYVMDFDHRDRVTKEDDIGRMQARAVSLTKLQTEIDKCDVVCANCHRERTFGAE